MQLLRYEGDVAEDLMTSFVLSRSNMFGELTSHPLKEGGAELLVNNENRQVRFTYATCSFICAIVRL